MLIYILFKRYAGVAELADALVLGTSVNDVEVQVLSPAPMTLLFELFIEQRDTNIILKRMVFFYFQEVIASQSLRVMIVSHSS